MDSQWASRLRSNRTPPWSDAHEDEPQGKSSCVVLFQACELLQRLQRVCFFRLLVSSPA